jgi:hypothetical protein
MQETYPWATAHSIKRGAALQLSEAAADQKIPLSLVSVLAKHKRKTPTIEDQTVGYLDLPQGRFNIAKAMLTHVATANL